MPRWRQKRKRRHRTQAVLPAAETPRHIFFRICKRSGFGIRPHGSATQRELRPYAAESMNADSSYSNARQKNKVLSALDPIKTDSIPPLIISKKTSHPLQVDTRPFPSNPLNKESAPTHKKSTKSFSASQFAKSTLIAPKFIILTQP